MTQLPTIGRIVHYVLADGQHRPALVVNAWDSPSDHPDHCNLTVFLDGLNDLQTESRQGGAASMSMTPERPGHAKDELVPQGAHNHLPGVLSVGSARNDESKKKPGTWHWPERV